MEGLVSMTMEAVVSCDTFVVVPPFTKNDDVIFGKNSDRPRDEVQEVVLVRNRPRSDKLQCTHISIDEAKGPINDVILSKPAWMWGAEMGANEKNVVIGNEAVWTKYNEGDGDARVKRLLGMDLVRLGLERGNTASGALKVITKLLEKYGQGGPCSEHDECLYYHNSFLIADCHEAWVLETSGKLWVAEKVSGYRNISNGLTIGTRIHKHSSNIFARSMELGLWDGEREFHFAEIFSSGGDEVRQMEGERLLRDASATARFDIRDMLAVLRHKESFICRGCNDAFPTVGSQVSTLSKDSVSVHWFTGTPDPSISFYKPFVFTPNAVISPFTTSFDKPKREHVLYALHARHALKPSGEELSKILREIEDGCLNEMEDFIRKVEAKEKNLDEISDLMKNCVETEVKLYN